MDRIGKIKAFPGGTVLANPYRVNDLQKYELALTTALDSPYKVPIYRSACWFIASFTGMADFELLFL
jgi:hypothetical protein